MKIYFLLISFSVLNLPVLKAQVVTTFAGSGAYGFVNATGTLASFNQPADVAVDASGNVYVADLENNKIRKITSGQVVSTLAGSGVRGSADATGTLASFNRPHGIAVDASGNVYVADEYNNKIRKITPEGVVTTLAGSGDFGSLDDSSGAFASFNAPNDVAVDASGNVYVADTYNHKIRKVTPAGVVTTLAGSESTGSVDAKGTSASFYYPSGVAVDASGNVYVGDTWNNKIRKITPTGIVTTLVGSGTTGCVDATGTSASFNYPWGVAVDPLGNVYVADQNNNKIRKIASVKSVTTLAGSGTSGCIDATGISASFRYPSGVAVDASGNIYIADESNNKIRKISLLK